MAEMHSETKWICWSLPADVDVVEQYIFPDLKTTIGDRRITGHGPLLSVLSSQDVSFMMTMAPREAWI